MTSDHLCPVCGYLGLAEAPWADGSGSLEICPSCGTQFGYDDAAGGDPSRRTQVHRQLRKRWRDRGCPWTSSGSVPPDTWDPQRQLATLDDDL